MTCPQHSSRSVQRPCGSRVAGPHSGHRSGLARRSYPHVVQGCCSSAPRGSRGGGRRGGEPRRGGSGPMAAARLGNAALANRAEMSVDARAAKGSRPRPSRNEPLPNGNGMFASGNAAGVRGDGIPRCGDGMFGRGNRGWIRRNGPIARGDGRCNKGNAPSNRGDETFARVNTSPTYDAQPLIRIKDPFRGGTGTGVYPCFRASLSSWGRGSSNLRGLPVRGWVKERWMAASMRRGAGWSLA